MSNPDVIQTDTTPYRFARGWFCLGLASDYTNEPQALNYFGTRLVAYRGESGQVHILDAYCPHMGADMSIGFVDGEGLRCPFHAWRWGSDGVCDHIPYASNIPPRAKIKAWPTMEENGLLFVWHDPEGNPPIEEQRIPRIDDYYEEDWSDWIIEKMTIHTDPRELLDNMADAGHFHAVHHSPAKDFKNIMDGHTYTQEMAAGSILVPNMYLESTATYFGPAVMTTFMQTWYEEDGIPVTKRLLVSHVPIDENNFDLRFGILIKKDPSWKPEEVENELKLSAKYTQIGFFQDVDVWHTKTRVDNPVLCDGDGPINKLRQWYSQFFMPVADIPESLKTRKEYTVKCPVEPDPEVTRMLLEHSDFVKWLEENNLSLENKM